MSAAPARIAIGALAVAGAAITAYLLYARYTGTALACPTGGCETVQDSRYARLAGIPVAGIGLAGYLTLLATTFVRAEAARAAALAISLVAVAFGAYLLVIQLTVIHAVCIWCVSSDVLVLLIALVAIADAVARTRGSSDAPPRGPARAVAARS